DPASCAARAKRLNVGARQAAVELALAVRVEAPRVADHFRKVVMPAPVACLHGGALHLLDVPRLGPRIARFAQDVVVEGHSSSTFGRSPLTLTIGPSRSRTLASIFTPMAELAIR